MDILTTNNSLTYKRGIIIYAYILFETFKKIEDLHVFLKGMNKYFAFTANDMLHTYFHVVQLKSVYMIISLSTSDSRVSTLSPDIATIGKKIANKLKKVYNIYVS